MSSRQTQSFMMGVLHPRCGVMPEGVLVEGSLALDNAVDAEDAAHKGISGSVAGNADVLLLADLISGDIFYKTCRRCSGNFCRE